MNVKGIKITFLLLILALVLMPFPIYAVEQTQIVSTWNWGSQYANQFTVTNFCEGSGTAVSCELRFTANNSYYGYLSFDGYNGTTKWINYKNVWIADGYGAYRYSLYQNGVIQINKINIEGGFLKSSMDNLDLEDIIDLLTVIETDTTSIDNQMNTELLHLQSIINNQIIQNGYLQTLTQLRQWNVPIESFQAVTYCLNKYDIYEYQNIYSYSQYPVFNLSANDDVATFFYNKNYKYILIFGTSYNFTYNASGLADMFSTTQSISAYSIKELYSLNAGIKIVYIEFQFPDNGNITIRLNHASFYIPIYSSLNLYKYYSTDFALRFGLSNQLLDDLHIIAQGTSQSNSAASGLESSNSTMASDMNSMATIENGYSQDFNSQLQNIDFTNPIQQNQGILPAANFVISIFNGLISSNPFSVLIIIVCILLIGKKVIGK